MPFLDLVDFCQLDCKHCYLNKCSRVMPLDMLRTICEDFLKTDFPLSQSELILSGGEPLLHPKFVEASNIVRKLNGHITMSTNGILIPKFIHTFQRNDGIQVIIDGDEKAHDFIRGKGSYEKAVRALKLLDEHGIRHSISFTINQANKHCTDHIIDLCVGTHQVYGMDRDEEICCKANGKERAMFARRLYRGRVHRPNTGFECSSRWHLLGLFS